MGKLFFENAQGFRREVATNISRDDCNKVIHDFIQDHNKGRPKDKKFHSYYTRTWEENGETVFDVGSHLEFFYYKN